MLFRSAAGYTGSQGEQGIQGYTGSIGDQGNIGFTGSQGDIGYTGSQGDAGGTGYTGSQGDQGNIGYTGSQGDIGYTGSKGDLGYTGSKGQDGNFGGAAFDYYYDASFTDDSDPGTGKFKFDNTNLSLVTYMYINHTDHNSVVATSFLQTIDDSTSGIKGHFSVMDEVNEAVYTMFAITGYHTESGNYFKVPVSYVSGSTSLTDELDVIITFARTGDKGDTGYTGSIGATGYTGSKGDQGNTGYTGSQGDQIGRAHV